MTPKKWFFGWSKNGAENLCHFQYGVFPPPTIGGSPRKIPWPRWLPPANSRVGVFDGIIIENRVEGSETACFGALTLRDPQK